MGIHIILRLEKLVKFKDKIIWGFWGFDDDIIYCIHKKNKVRVIAMHVHVMN